MIWLCSCYIKVLWLIYFNILNCMLYNIVLKYSVTLIRYLLLWVPRERLMVWWILNHKLNAPSFMSSPRTSVIHFIMKEEIMIFFIFIIIYTDTSDYVYICLPNAIKEARFLVIYSCFDLHYLDRISWISRNHVIFALVFAYLKRIKEASYAITIPKVF